MRIDAGRHRSASALESNQSLTALVLLINTPSNWRLHSTCLKVFGEGEWKVKKHGVEKRRTWRKLHLAVDVDTNEAISAEVSLVNVGDSEVLPTLLNPLRRKVTAVSADGAYDTRNCHETLRNKGCTPLIPPRKNAAHWEDGHLRNEAVTALKNGTIAGWKAEPLRCYITNNMKRACPLGLGACSQKFDFRQWPESIAF